MEKPELINESKPIENEGTVKIRSFIQSGLVLIKDNKFKEAIEYFQNGGFARSLGLDYSNEPGHIILQRTPTDEEIPEILRVWSNKTSFRPTFPSGGTPTIKLAQILAFDPNDFDKKIDIPVIILHNVALGYAEEWVHALQYLRAGKSFETRGSITEYSNGEVDVAVYFFREGVPLTPLFMQNQPGREEAIAELKAKV